MSLTAYLMILYLISLVIDIIAFIQGRKNKKWMPFVMITTVILAGTAALVCLWLMSPM